VIWNWYNKLELALDLLICITQTFFSVLGHLFIVFQNRALTYNWPKVNVSFKYLCNVNAFWPFVEQKTVIVFFRRMYCLNFGKQFFLLQKLFIFPVFVSTFLIGQAQRNKILKPTLKSNHIFLQSVHSTFFIRRKTSFGFNLMPKNIFVKVKSN